MTFDELMRANEQLAFKIDQAKQSGDNKLGLELKREYYQNKLAILDIIGQEEKERAAIPAKVLRDRIKNTPIPPRYATGIHSLDNKLKGGIEVGTFIQLSGESGAGKTTLVLTILANVAKYNRCDFFNFEMGERRIVNRFEKLLREDQQWDNLHVDSYTRSIDDLCNEIKISARDGVKFFMIDSMMKIETTKDHIIEQQNEISHKLSKLSQEKEIIIFLINQQSEEALKHNRLSLKGSNNQKYDADMVFFLMIDDGKRELVCAKNRQDEYLFNLDISLSDLQAPQEVEITYQSVQMPKGIA